MPSRRWKQTNSSKDLEADLAFLAELRKVSDPASYLTLAQRYRSKGAPAWKKAGIARAAHRLGLAPDDGQRARVELHLKTLSARGSWSGEDMKRIIALATLARLTRGTSGEATRL